MKQTTTPDEPVVELPERIWIDSPPRKGMVTAYISPMTEAQTGKRLSTAYVRDSNNSQDQDSVEMQNEQAEREMQQTAPCRSSVDLPKDSLLDAAVDFDNATFYAFRYCLGRQTYVVDECVGILTRNWTRLTDATRTMIKKEIREAFERNRYGSTGDRAMWASVLDLPNSLTQATSGSEPSPSPDERVLQPETKSSAHAVYIDHLETCVSCKYVASVHSLCPQGRALYRTVYETSAPATDVSTPSKQDYDAAYEAVEQTGLGVQFRSCSCGQLPCAKLRPIAQAIANARVSVVPDNSLAEAVCRHCGQPIKAGEATGAWLHTATGQHRCEGNTHQRAEANTSASPAPDNFRETVVNKIRELARVWYADKVTSMVVAAERIIVEINKLDEFSKPVTRDTRDNNRTNNSPASLPDSSAVEARARECADDETKSLGSVEEKNLVDEGNSV